MNEFVVVVDDVDVGFSVRSLLVANWLRSRAVVFLVFERVESVKL